MNYQSAIESLLFVAGEDGLSVSQLVALLNTTVFTIEESIEKLKESYDLRESGITIVMFANKYQMVTRGKYAEIIKQYAISPFASKLSQASLETLAIIAYKQPITRSKIDEIRGVQSTNALSKLQLRDLIEAKGKEQSPGKPILYGTTDYFLDYFGMTTLEELPDISNLEIATSEEIEDLFSKRYEKNDLDNRLE